MSRSRGASAKREKNRKGSEFRRFGSPCGLLFLLPLLLRGGGYPQLRQENWCSSALRTAHRSRARGERGGGWWGANARRPPIRWCSFRARYNITGQPTHGGLCSPAGLWSVTAPCSHASAAVLYEFIPLGEPRIGGGPCRRSSPPVAARVEGSSRCFFPLP